jgi:hypothetical protein
MTRTNTTLALGSLLGPEGETTEGKCTDCREPLLIPMAVVHWAKLLSNGLRATGQPPLTTGSVVRCDGCGAKWRAEQARLSQGLQRDTERVFGRLRELRREIEDGDTPESAWEIKLEQVPGAIRAGHRDSLDYAKYNPPRAKRRGGGGEKWDSGRGSK